MQTFFFNGFCWHLITSWGWSHTPISPVKPSISWLLLHPQSTFRNGSAHTSPLSVFLARSAWDLLLPHTPYANAKAQKPRERERVGGFVYLGSWVQLVLQAYSNKVFVREKARRREKCIWRREEQRTKIWVEKKNILFLLYLSLISTDCGFLFCQKKERVN